MDNLTITMDLAPFAEWFAADEALAEIVGDRISTKGLNGFELPALQISCVHGDDDNSPLSVVQFNAWAEGADCKPLAEAMQRILVDRIGTIPADLFSSASIIRCNLTGMAPTGGFKTERRRVSIDVEVTREGVA